MSDTLVGSAFGQRLVRQTEIDRRKWWVVEARVGVEWEPTSGGFTKKTEALAEARRQLDVQGFMEANQ